MVTIEELRARWGSSLIEHGGLVTIQPDPTNPDHWRWMEEDGIEFREYRYQCEERLSEA